MTGDQDEEGEWATVTIDVAADWLIRSAFPAFCGLGDMFAEDAEWFRLLEPFQGHTPFGRLKGWSGVGKRVVGIETRLRTAYAAVLEDARRLGRPIRAIQDPSLDAYLVSQVRVAAVFARQNMLPSRVGWDAYRVIGRMPRFVAAAGQFYGMEDEASDEIAAAWNAAYLGLADRAILFELEGEVGDSASVAP